MNNLQFAKRTALTVPILREKVPSVYAKRASAKMSDNYTFVPSTMVIDALAKIGYVPVDGSQRRARGDASVARHLVRFAHEGELLKARKVDDLLTEVVLVNSHNGRTALKLYYGLFRFICGNGLIVSEAMVGMNRRHIGDVKTIMEETHALLDQGPKVIKVVKAMRALKLPEPKRLILAENALALRYEDKHERGKPVTKPTIVAEQLLIPRRPEDRATDLWHTFNVIQENLITGGITGRSSLGRPTHTRQLQDVRKLVSVNTDLWELATNML